MLELERDTAEPPPAPTDGDGHFVAGYRALMDRLPPPDPFAPARDAAADKLVAEHPGRYVAYRVVRTGDQFHAELVAVGDSYRDIFAVTDALSDAERALVTVTYSTPPAFAVVATPFLFGRPAGTGRADRGRPCPD